MSLPTYNITVTVLDSSSNPVEGVLITAILNRTEIDRLDASTYIIPNKISTETGSDGTAVLALWSNLRGATESQYRFIATNPKTGFTYFDVMGTVPERDSTLSQITQIPPYPGMSEGQASIDTAVRASAEASVILDRMLTIDGETGYTKEELDLILEDITSNILSNEVGIITGASAIISLQNIAIKDKFNL